MIFDTKFLTTIFLKNIFLFFLIFIYLFFLSSGFDLNNFLFGTWANLPINTTYSYISINHNGSDEASYIQLGERYVNFGILDGGLNGGWPPLMSLIHTLFIVFFGMDFTPFYAFYFFILLLWTSIFYLLIKIIWQMKQIFNKLSLLTLIFLVSISNVLNGFFLKQALIISEGLSIPFFILGLIFLFLKSNKKDNKFIDYLIPAIFFLLATLTRGIFDVVFTLFVFFIIFFYLIRFLIFNKFSFDIVTKDFQINFNQLAKFPILVITFLYLFLIAPYKFFFFIQHGEFAVTANNKNHLWEQNWSYDEDLISKGGQFVVDGGATIICKINSNLCNKINDCEFCFENEFYKSNTYKTILTNFHTWIYHKIPLSAKFWFSSPPYVGAHNNHLDLMSIVTEIFPLILLVYVLINLVIYIFRNFHLSNLSNKFLFNILVLSLILALIIPPFMFHFEVRYFYPIKVIISICFILMFLDKKNK